MTLQKESRSKSPGTEVPSPATWSTRKRIVLSLLVSIHVIALLVEPMSMFSRSGVRPFGADVAWIRSTLGPYVDMIYLDHGYFFFAPNPGPNHLVECTITPMTATSMTADSKNTNDMTSGSSQGTSSIPSIGNGEKQILVFPDKRVHWPRLFYHRHFMLSEFYHNAHAWTDQPIEAKENPVIDREWRAELNRYLQIQGSIVKHLKSRFPASEVGLRRIEHQLPNEVQVLQQGWKLTDKRLYDVVPESLQERDAKSAGPGQGPIKVVPPLRPPMSVPAVRDSQGGVSTPMPEEIFLVPKSVPTTESKQP